MESNRDENASRVWVIVETTKGVGQIFSYRGTVDRRALEAWTTGTLEGALTLEEAYWLEEDASGRAQPIVVGRHPGFRNGTGVLHLHVATVMVVMELRSPDPGVLAGENAQVLSIGAVRGPRAVPDEEE